MNTKTLKCYTDGSKMGNRCGLGIVLLSDNKTTSLSQSHKIGDHCTIFQAETLAISLSCNVINNYLDDNPTCPRIVNILTDSQSAFMALNNPVVKSETVLQCIGNLNHLALNTDVTISWIKAHNNYPGNELADEMAKKGLPSHASKT